MRPGRVVVRGLAALGLFAVCAGPARALPPEIVIGAGWSMAVNGGPGTGGAAATVAAQWPCASRGPGLPRCPRTGAGRKA